MKPERYIYAGLWISGPKVELIHMCLDTFHPEFNGCPGLLDLVEPSSRQAHPKIAAILNCPYVTAYRVGGADVEHVVRTIVNDRNREEAKKRQEQMKQTVITVDGVKYQLDLDKANEYGCLSRCTDISVGQKFRHTSGEVYVLSCPEYHRIVLICIDDGLRWSDVVAVEKDNHISEKEWEKVTGHEPTSFTRINGQFTQT